MYCQLTINVLLSNLSIANNSQEIVLDIVYFMTQLDEHQTDFTLLVRDNFVCRLFIHYLFCFRYFAIYVSLFCFSATEVAMSRR